MTANYMPKANPAKEQYFTLHYHYKQNTQPLPMMKILIVDDEPNILLSLDFLARKAGYEPFLARNGKEALALLQDTKPSLVLLDIMMPDIDGYQLCQHIKSQPDAPKVIFLSAKSRETDISLGYTLGADAYITKPFSTKFLLQEIRRILS